MLRVVHHRARRSLLDDPAEVHDRDPVGEARGGREIVGDHQDAEAVLAQSVEQVEDACAYRDVEHRDGLVGHEQLGPEDDARRDRDALALPARELVRVAVEEELRRIELHATEGLPHALAPIGLRVAEAVDDERLLDCCLHGEARVERLVRVLVDQLHPPPQRAQRPRLQARDLAAVELDPAGDGLDQPQHRLRGGGLAAARLAHEREQLAAREREADALDRVDEALRLPRDAADEAAVEGIADDQLVDREQRPRPVRAHRTSATTSFRWQAAERAPSRPRRAGRSSRQRPNTRSQREWNGQPWSGRSSRGGAPGIEAGTPSP